MSTITLPGLIDPHVHMRDPWQLQKEDFYTGTSAALAGGFTTILDMPNNEVHVVTEELLNKKIDSAQKQIVCDLGFNFSALTPETIPEFEKVKNKSVGLKLFITLTNNMDNQRALSDIDDLTKVCDAWPRDKVVMFHAEDDTVALGIEALRRTKRPVHFCHISSIEEMTPILEAKSAGLPVSFGVCPHHLFLTRDDEENLGPFARMKPSLKSSNDQKFLWDHINDIDVIESDHAPHTKDEKNSDKPPFGVPGLETTLALMLTAEQEGKLSRSHLLNLLHHNAARIFSLPTDENTKVTVDMSEYEIRNEDLKTKCGWSPFAGRRVVGKVTQVDLRGQTVFKDGEVLAKPGSGRVISS